MISNGRRMAVSRQRFEVLRFPAMQSTFCFPNVAITIPAASLINYFRPKGTVESVFIGEKDLIRQVFLKNNFRIKTTIELVST